MEEGTGKQEKGLSTSPLSSDEGLVLAEEEEFDMDLDVDRYKTNFEKSLQVRFYYIPLFGLLLMSDCIYFIN
jgi:hypothetical protein